MPFLKKMGLYLHSLLSSTKHMQSMTRRNKPNQTTKAADGTTKTASIVPPNDQLNEIVLYNYRITYLISPPKTPSSGTIYGGQSLEDWTDVAIKSTTRSCAEEVLILNTLLDTYPRPLGFPTVYSCGFMNTHFYSVTQLLGCSVHDYSCLMGGKLNLKSVCMIALQMIERLEHIHEMGVLHCDINPHNMVMGRGKERNIVYVVGYGRSVRFRDHKCNHIPRTTGNFYTSDITHASVNVHAGVQPSRRDDMISLSYVLIRLLKGSLPWENGEGKELSFGSIVRLKREACWNILCTDLPVQFKVFVKKVFGLAFSEEPEYDGYARLFRECMQGLRPDGVFQWMERGGEQSGVTEELMGRW